MTDTQKRLNAMKEACQKIQDATEEGRTALSSRVLIAHNLGIIKGNIAILEFKDTWNLEDSDQIIDHDGFEEHAMNMSSTEQQVTAQQIHDRTEINMSHEGIN